MYMTNSLQYNEKGAKIQIVKEADFFSQIH